MSIALYRRYRQVLKNLPSTGRFMPYKWGNIPDPIGAQWMIYSIMFDEFSRELANAINAFTHDVQRLQAWAVIVKSMSDQQKMYIAREFVETLATNAVNKPYVLRSRFIFSAAHLCHQANGVRECTWKDDFPIDKKIYMGVADIYGKGWRKYPVLKRQLEKIGGKYYENATRDFRNLYNHRFSPRFLVGITQLVTRMVDESSGRVSYGIGGSDAFDLDMIAGLLVNERDCCYQAFDGFQALVREHEASI